MKTIIILYVLFLLASCTSNNTNEKLIKSNIKQPITNIPSQLQDSTSWIENFKDFRNAVYHANKTKAKEYINFKSLSESAGIWYLIYLDNEKELDKVSTSEPKIINEKDFEKYFDKIFSPVFISCIQKIKTEVLAKTGSYETVEIKEGKATSYIMYANYDKNRNSIGLNLASKTTRKNELGEIMDGGEFNTIYVFSILSNGQIQFKYVTFAG
jgi:hypothetical protein